MINYDLTSVKAIIFDVDGVLSLSTIQMSPAGLPVRTVNIKDGYAIQLAIKMGMKIAIISGGTDPSIEERYRKLGMTDIFMSCSTKIQVLNQYLADNHLSADEVIYVGDDIPDYEIMKVVAVRAVLPMLAATSRKSPPTSVLTRVARVVLATSSSRYCVPRVCGCLQPKPSDGSESVHSS